MLLIPSHAVASSLKAISLSAGIFVASASITLAAGAITNAPTKVFDGPLLNAGVIATVPAGVRVGILWCGEGQKWCLINFHAKQGFISAAALQPLDGAFGGSVAANHHGAGGKVLSDGDDGPRSLAEGNSNGGGGGPQQAHDFGNVTLTQTAHDPGPVSVGTSIGPSSGGTVLGKTTPPHLGK